MTGASPLPTLESERFQSRVNGKRDGITSSFPGVFLEQVVIQVGEVTWFGWIYEDYGVTGLFIDGQQNWGDVNLRKG